MLWQRWFKKYKVKEKSFGTKGKYPKDQDLLKKTFNSKTKIRKILQTSPQLVKEIIIFFQITTLKKAKILKKLTIIMKMLRELKITKMIPKNKVLILILVLRGISNSLKKEAVIIKISQSTVFKCKKSIAIIKILRIKIIFMVIVAWIWQTLIIIIIWLIITTILTQLSKIRSQIIVLIHRA
mgnify:CR=1 FL=1